MKNLKEKSNEYKCCYCGTAHHNEFENCRNCGSNKYIKTKTDVLTTSNLLDYAEYLQQTLKIKNN